MHAYILKANIFVESTFQPKVAEKVRNIRTPATPAFSMYGCLPAVEMKSMVLHGTVKIITLMMMMSMNGLFEVEFITFLRKL